MAKANSLGGVTEAEIKALAEASGGPPGDAGASALTRFVRKLATLVRLRADKGEAGNIALFLQSAALAHDLAERESQEAPLLTNGNDPICGRVWLSAAGLGTAYAITLDWSDPGTLFQAVRKAGLGRLPAVVVDLRDSKPTARLYPRGIELDSSDDYTPIDLADEPIAPEDMKAALDHFYRKSLRTPALIVEGHALAIWKKASHGFPEDRPEERIHGRLMDTLRARFTRHEVRAEVFSDQGRVDIVVWTPTSDNSGRPAMRNDWALELKALADRTANGQPVSNSVCDGKLHEGVMQASAYREGIKALRAALCCYDMRKDDKGDAACFKSIIVKAAQEKIELWRWFLYRSTAKGRQAASAAKGGRG